MARLSKEKANQAEQMADEAPDFGVCPPGVYLCRLRDVNTERSGPAGPYWTWEYETVGVEDEPNGKRFWDNTSLSEKAIGRLGKVFQAFGATTDADTDDLIGKPVSVEVKIGTVKGGERAGEQRNEVVSVHPAETHAWYHVFEAEHLAGATASADDLG